MIIIKQQGVYTLRQIVIIKITYLKKFNVGVKGSRILVPRVFQLQDSFKNNYPRLCPTFQVKCLTSWACYNRFILNWISFILNSSKCRCCTLKGNGCDLNQRKVFEQPWSLHTVQVPMTCLEFLAYLINSDNWSPISPSIIWPGVLRKNHKPLGRQPA